MSMTRILISPVEAAKRMKLTRGRIYQKMMNGEIEWKYGNVKVKRVIWDTKTDRPVKTEN